MGIDGDGSCRDSSTESLSKVLISLHIRFCTGAVRKRIKSVAPIKEVEAQTSSSDVGIISGVGLVLFTTTVRNIFFLPQR